MRLGSDMKLVLYLTQVRLVSDMKLVLYQNVRLGSDMKLVLDLIFKKFSKTQQLKLLY